MTTELSLFTGGSQHEPRLLLQDGRLEPVRENKGRVGDSRETARRHAEGAEAVTKRLIDLTDEQELFLRISLSVLLNALPMEHTQSEEAIRTLLKQVDKPAPLDPLDWLTEWLMLDRINRHAQIIVRGAAWFVSLHTLVSHDIAPTGHMEYVNLSGSGESLGAALSVALTPKETQP